MNTNCDHLKWAFSIGKFACTHCGEEWPAGRTTLNDLCPMPVDMFGVMSQSFAKEHRDCRPSPEGDALREHIRSEYQRHKALEASEKAL